MRVGLIYDSPGYAGSALDRLRQIARLLEEQGHESLLLDPFGRLLEQKFGNYPTKSITESGALDITLWVSRAQPNFLEGYSYIADWQPLDNLLDLEQSDPLKVRQHMAAVQTATLSHDHVLLTLSEEMDEFHFAQNSQRRWNPGTNVASLHPTCAIEPNLKPIDLIQMRLCYVESENPRPVGRKKRGGRNPHEAVVLALDADDRFHFYGVGYQHGVDLKEHLVRYVGEFPLDAGSDMVRTMNAWGVALVLSSDAERRSGFAPARLFQALAARCIVISDNNPFIVKYFGESVLTVEYDADATVTAARIQRQLDWVSANPVEASAKAEAAHHTFRNLFSLNAEIVNILDKHPKNAMRQQNAWRKAGEQTVDIYFICDESRLRSVKPFLQQLQTLDAVKVHGVIATPVCCAEPVRVRVNAWQGDQESPRCTVMPIEGFAGKAIGSVFYEAFSAQGHGHFFALWEPGLCWRRDHTANLVLECLDSGNLSAQAANWFYQDAPVETSPSMPQRMQPATAGTHPPPLSLDELLAFARERVEFGAFLFSSKLLIQNWGAMTLLKYLDGYYPFLFLLSNFVRHNRLPGYVPRFSCARKVDSSRPPITEKVKHGGDIRPTTDTDIVTKRMSDTHQISLLKNLYASSNNYRIAASLIVDVGDTARIANDFSP